MVIFASHRFQGIAGRSNNEYRILQRRTSVEVMYSARRELPCRTVYFIPKLSDFPTAIIICAGQFSGGDKPHPYLFGESSFVVAGFIPDY